MAAPGSGGRLVALPLAWLVGVALQLQQRDLWRLDGYGSIAAAGLVVAIAGAWSRRAFALVTLAVLASGFAIAGMQASLRLAETLPAALEGRDLVVTGVVANLPQQGPSGLRFRFEIDPGGAPAGVPGVVALGWYAGFHEDAAAVQPRVALRAGQRWRFTVRLRQPHGNLNPHGFDYELALLEQGVRATGYVRDAPATLLDDRAGRPVERLRQRVRDAIYAHVDDRRAAGVLAALAIGDQGAIERDDWDLFRNTGVAHLMSISGLHVTMFAWLAGVLIGAAWRRSARAMRRLPAPAAARWGGLAAATTYAFVAGWGVPSQRTVWMLATVTLLQAGGLRWPWMLVLLTAAFVVTLFDPWAC
ncbi:MAG TPA: ComEC/Rec2 family competence protein [Caldimonas sp.]|nr:ComEC/Rec2 family competence protein [Caldimonas sp.]